MNPCRRARRNRRPAGRDQGVTDIIANLLLVALTVVLAVGAGYVIIYQVDTGDPVRSSVRMDNNGTALSLVHRGGDAIAMDTATLLIETTSGQEQRPLADFTAQTIEGDQGDPVYWEYGESVCITGYGATCWNYQGKDITDVQLLVAGSGREATLFTSWSGQVTGQPGIGNSDPNAGFTSGCSGFDCTFTDTSTDDGSITAWDWDFGDGAGSSSQQNPSYTYTAAGTYTVTLEVTDDDGATDTATGTVTVPAAPNQAPTASFTVTPASPTAGDPVTFDASGSSDPDGDSLTYGWDWTDDGTIDETTSDPTDTASHTYTTPGTYTVELRVTDGNGGADTTTETITVAAGATLTYLDCPLTANDGSATDCAGAQSDSDSDAAASLVEQAPGNAPRNSLEVDAGFSSVPSGTHELQIRYRTQGDTEAMTLEAWDGSDWTDRGTLSATSSFQVFTYTLTAAEHNGGSPMVRFSDAGNDATATTLELEYVRIETT